MENCSFDLPARSNKGRTTPFKLPRRKRKLGKKRKGRPLPGPEPVRDQYALKTQGACQKKDYGGRKGKNNGSGRPLHVAVKISPGG